jgi:hypothetical protein
MIVLAGLSVTLKQLNFFLQMDVFGTLAAYLVMGAAGSMTLLIFIRLQIGMRKQKRE